MNIRDMRKRCIDFFKIRRVMVQLKNGDWALHEKWMFSTVTATFGDGVGNDTGTPVVFKTKEELIHWTTGGVDSERCYQ